MNKALHVLVYVFLALAGAALYFEIKLDAKRTELTDRNRLQEDYLVKIAKTIEQADPVKGEPFEIKKDVSPVEAKEEDNPMTENLLEEYPNDIEQQNLKAYNWSQNERDRMRHIYQIDPVTGQPIQDGTGFLMTGKGTADELLNELFESAKKQQARLNTTRARLAEMRGRLEDVVNELNKLKGVARTDKCTIVNRDGRISKLEEEKKELEGNIVKLKAQIEELNAEITSLKDEVATAKDETEAAKEEVSKRQKLIERLQKIIQELMAARAQGQGGGGGGGGSAVTSLPAGDKGKIIEADNNDMFAVVEFSDEAMLELKGPDQSKPLPVLELSVKRPGFNGTAGEFVGRLRIRQEVPGKKYIICDILSDWEQDKIKADDIVFAD
jgi:outer membrane murein-binding lipoprotein Lpp